MKKAKGRTPAAKVSDGKETRPGTESAARGAASGSSVSDGTAAAQGGLAGQAAGAAAATDTPSDQGEQHVVRTPEAAIAAGLAIDFNVTAAINAAVMAYGGTGHGFLCNGPNGDAVLVERAQAAAAFVRANRDAKPETIGIHLRLSRFTDLPEPMSGRAAMAWDVFTATLNRMDAQDRTEREAQEAAAKAAADATRPRPARRRDLAMAPIDRDPRTEIARRR